MSSSQIKFSQKRKRLESTNLPPLAEADRTVLDAIKRKENMGIWTRDIKTTTKLPEAIINRSLKALQTLNLIKEFKHVQYKARRYVIATEFEPSKEVTGGSWYLDGVLDTELINALKDPTLKTVRKLKVATAEGVFDFLKNAGAADCTLQQISEILRSMVLDNEIIEVKSTGLGEYRSIPIGTFCYRCPPVAGLNQGQNAVAMASIPCGVCPRISQCTPDGIISPSNCVYYTKWLDY